MRSFVPSALALAVAGCAYQPGSFVRDTQPFPGVHATISCLDIGIDRRPDLELGQAVLAYAFGNRCDHAAVVDLADVAVVARDAAGHAVALRAFDPRHQLEALPLDGRSTGEEAIAYFGVAPGADVCVDTASIAHESPPQWRCFPGASEEVP